MQIKRLACAGLLATACALAWSTHVRRKARAAWSAMPTGSDEGAESPALAHENSSAWLMEHQPTEETTDEELERWLDAFFLKASEASSPAGQEGN